MTKQIQERAHATIGGITVAKYKGYEDDLEIILIVRSRDVFYAVIAQGRQAHRGLKLQTGQAVEVRGTIVDYSSPATCGYKVAYAIACERLRPGEEVLTIDDPFGEYEELSKMHVLQKCNDLNEQ